MVWSVIAFSYLPVFQHIPLARLHGFTVNLYCLDSEDMPVLISFCQNEPAAQRALGLTASTCYDGNRLLTFHCGR